MSEGGPWQSNWKSRLYERVREHGYEDDFNAVQVFSGLVAEAERSHQLTRLERRRTPPHALA